MSGPIEVRLNQENASRATLEVHVRPLAAIPGTEHKALASHISAALQPSLILTQNPRSLVQLIVQDLVPISHFSKRFNGYSLEQQQLSSKLAGASFVKERALAAMINASTLAFLKTASVPMRGVVCAVFVARLGGDVELSRSLCVVDPSDEEMTTVEAGGAFAFLFVDGTATCVWSNWQGRKGFAVEDVLEAKERAMTAAEKVWHRMKAALSGSEGSCTMYGKSLRTFHC